MKLKTSIPVSTENPSSPSGLSTKSAKTLSADDIAKTMPLGNSPMMNGGKADRGDRKEKKREHKEHRKEEKKKEDKREHKREHSKERTKDKDKEEHKAKKSKKEESAKASKPVEPYVFGYPKTSLPPPSLVKAVYEAHNASGKVKIDEVIVSICKNENEELKKMQGKLQRGLSGKEKDSREAKSDEEKLDAVQRARVAVKDIERSALLALGDARTERQAIEQAAKTNNPANQKLWNEVATLMKSISTLKTEEKAWHSALTQCEEREKMLASGFYKDDELEHVTGDFQVPALSTEINKTILPAVNNKIKESVEDITLAADRISSVLRSVNALVEEAEDVKKELYDLHVNNGNMFKGYKGVEDPKALIRGLLG
jgi:hypothetical protein